MSVEQCWLLLWINATLGHLYSIYVIWYIEFHFPFTRMYKTSHISTEKQLCHLKLGFLKTLYACRFAYHHGSLIRQFLKSYYPFWLKIFHQKFLHTNHLIFRIVITGISFLKHERIVLICFIYFAQFVKQSSHIMI